MLEWFDPYRGISAQALVLRMVLSLCCGSLIGIEREFKRHFNALKGSAESAYYGLSDKAAVYLIKICIICYLSHFFTLFSL